MKKLKLLSGAISLAILCSTASVQAESVVGQLVATPTATINAGANQHVTGSQATAYIQGDTITTGSEASASLSFTSGETNLVVAPNTTMAVLDASTSAISLTHGAVNVTASINQSVSVSTSVGVFELASPTAIDAVVVFDKGQFSAISNDGLLTVTSQSGAVITAVESGNAYIFDGKKATSVDVQAAPVATTAATTTTLTTVAIAAGVVGTTALVASEISDGDDAEASSPSE